MQEVKVKLMKINELAAAIDAVMITDGAGHDKEISGMYACDLMSWVMSHAAKDNAWITVHTHVNIVAVALMADISCIIIPEGIQVEEGTVKRAVSEGVAILSTALNTYEICSRVPGL